MLQMGGRQILNGNLGKNLKSSPDYIYEWVDPKQPPFSSAGDFLMARTTDKFERLYSQEKSFQEQALRNTPGFLETQSKCIFANEMIQLYQFFARAAKDQELTFGDELRAALPKSRREYDE
jgi:hypothetical protein